MANRPENTRRAPRGAVNTGTAANPGNPWDRFRRWATEHLPGGVWHRLESRRWLLAAVLFAGMLAILLANRAPEILDLQEGQVAPVDVMAPRDVIDRYRTDRLREEAARQAIREASQDQSNFEINPAVALQAEEATTAIFDAWAKWRDELSPHVPSAETPGPADSSPAQAMREEPSGEQSSPEQPTEEARSESAWPLIADETQVEEARAYLSEELGYELARSVTGQALRASPAQFVKARELATRVATQWLSGQRIGDDQLEETRRAASSLIDEQAEDSTIAAIAAPVAGVVMAPNLILSPEKMERARQEAVRNVQDVVVREGQVIVRRGDPIEAGHIQLLRDLGMLQPGPSYGEWFGTALLLVLLFSFVGVYAHQFLPDLLREDRLLALFGLVIVLVTGLARIAALVPWDGALFLVPVALASMLVALLIDSRLGLVATIVLGVVIGVVSHGDVNAVTMALAGGVTGVFSVSKISQRGDLTRAGFVIGGACTLMMLALGLAQSAQFFWEFAFLGIVNGLVAAVATIGLLPYVEGLFGITSTIRLLELSNPNQPLLRKLLMEAPGSYHHSMIVGNLSEAAADAIGADSLLVRVGSLYHDVGKTKRPYFFVENQFGADNPHDKISPSLSTLIITSHVKDGIELAREYNLPQVLVDFIREHHGTALVKYFYQKALETAKEDTVEEKDFRYPGPRPQSRETAIVMLADSVEAAVRSLSRPTPGRIEGLVRKIVKEKLADGELDESNLTLRDLDRIADAFVRILTGIFHKRVEYPELTTAESERKTG